MSHQQLTAMIATQHGHDLQRRSAQARRVMPAGPHGLRIKTAPAPAKPSRWSRVAGAVGRLATPTPAGRSAAVRAPELNLV
jgi:hypothetical protein